MPARTRANAKYAEIDTLINQALALRNIYNDAKPGQAGLTNLYGFAFWATDMPNTIHFKFIDEIERVARYVETEILKVKGEIFPRIKQDEVDKLKIEQLVKLLKGVTAESRHDLQTKADGYISSSANSVLYRALNSMLAMSYEEAKDERATYQTWLDQNLKEAVEQAVPTI